MKKNDELLRIIGDIDDDMIEKAEPDRTKRKKIVWISIASTAALLAVVAGLQYQFFIRPLMNAPDTGDSEIVTGTAVTSVSEMTSDDKTSGCTILKVVPDEGSDILSRELLPSESGNIRILENSREELLYTGVTYNGIDYDFSEMMKNNTSSGPVNGTVTDSHIFIHFRNGLFSSDMKTGISYGSGNENFHTEFDASGSTSFLGADLSENIYILNRDESRYTLMEFSPDIKLSGMENSGEISADSAELPDGYKPLFDSASGYDTIHLEGSVLNIVYSGDCEMKYDLSTGTYYSDCEFVSETKERDDENGVYRSGEYITAYDREGNAVLKLCLYTDEPRTGNLVDRICYTDGYLDVYSRTDDTFARGNKAFDTEGNEISNPESYTEYVYKESEFSDRISDLNFYPDRKMLSDFNSGICVLYDTGFSVSDVPEGKYVKYARLADDGSVLCCMSENAGSDITAAAVVSRSGEYREITDERVVNHIENGVFYPSPQYDGTFAYIADGVLNSYDTHTDTLSVVCRIEKEYNYSSPTNFIEKVNDKVYCLPPSAYDSDTRVFYILTVD